MDGPDGGRGKGRLTADSRMRGEWMPKPRYHRLNLRVDEDVYRRIRDEAEAWGISVSAVIRMAIDNGLAGVGADRIRLELERRIR